jgi:hypothetical protein
MFQRAPNTLILIVMQVVQSNNMRTNRSVCGEIPWITLQSQWVALQDCSNVPVGKPANRGATTATCFCTSDA